MPLLSSKKIGRAKSSVLGSCITQHDDDVQTKIILVTIRVAANLRHDIDSHPCKKPYLAVESRPREQMELAPVINPFLFYKRHS
jgi:hypothetical protein